MLPCHLHLLGGLGTHSFRLCLLNKLLVFLLDSSVIALRVLCHRRIGSGPAPSRMPASLSEAAVHTGRLLCGLQPGGGTPLQASPRCPQAVLPEAGVCSPLEEPLSAPLVLFTLPDLFVSFP